jgi:hypothetical protein
MIKLGEVIEGSKKLTQIFGRWPSFHDAEVLDLSLWRGDVDPEHGRYIFPVLTTTIHLWEMTRELDTHGFFVLKDHTLATPRFHEVHDLRMEGFNHQNAIFDLSINKLERMKPPSSYFAVEIEPSFGVGASFTCLREVRDAVLCGANGKVDQHAIDPTPKIQ